jgi:hypothetical protein
VPDDNCLIVPSGSPCNFIDSIKQIYLEPGFGFQTPVPPTDSDHQILIRIDSITGVLSECLPYIAFSTNNPSIPIFFGGGGSIGSPTNPANGLGQPDLYTTSNHVIEDPTPGGIFTLDPSWHGSTTVADLISALATQRVGAPITLTYFASDARTGSYLQLHPDFAGCDAAGDVNFSTVEYGDVEVGLLLEVFQATP